MQIFEIVGGAIYNASTSAGYCNCKVLGGGYSHGLGFYAEIRAIGQEDEFMFRINDPNIYDKMIQAYLSNETIGVILF